MDILETIVANKRLEVARQKEVIPVDMLLSTGAQRLNTQTVSMSKALASSSTGIIAEFKRRSPSKGWLHQSARVEDVIPAYEAGGATACSVLTDSDFFGGSFTDLKNARRLVQLPLLRKDFVIDEYQIFQARILGADAVLLIAAILDEDECSNLARMAHQLDMNVLLEIHSEDELSYINEDIDMLGVNNRNLGTFATDTDNSFRLIEKMKAEAGSDILLVSESGISSASDIIRLREAGFRGFLLGEAFMKTDDPGATLAMMIEELL
jgi:indole-3-glycerol phosphate synthase